MKHQNNSRYIFILLLLLLASPFYLEAQPGKIRFELLNATSTNSKKHFNYNTNNHWYFEARGGYRFNKYFESSLSVGYQLRSYIYFARFDQPYSEVPLYMERNYVPVALNARLYLSEFFHEKLKLWSKKEKWDIYTQVSVATILGSDKNDPNEAELRAQGAFVPFYRFPYVDVYKHLQISYVAGVRLNFNKHIGLFVEGGEGLLMNAVFGLSLSF